MKKLLLIVTLFLACQIYAQVFQVLVETKHQKVYSEKGLEMFMDIKDPESRKWNIEQNQNPPVLDYEFLVDAHQMNSIEQEKINNEQESIGTMKYSVPGLAFGTTYFDLENLFALTAFDVYGKNYISKTPLQDLEWIYHKEFKEILGYRAQKITTLFNDYQVEAWITKEVKIDFMPSSIKPLNGFILEMNYYMENEYGVMNNFVKVKSIKKIKKNSFDKIVKSNNKIPVVSPEEMEEIWDEANRKRNEMFNNNDGVDKK